MSEHHKTSEQEEILLQQHSDFRRMKKMAKTLSKETKELKNPIPLMKCLEIVAKQQDFPSWWKFRMTCLKEVRDMLTSQVYVQTGSSLIENAWKIGETFSSEYVGLNDSWASNGLLNLGKNGLAKEMATQALERDFDLFYMTTNSLDAECVAKTALSSGKDVRVVNFMTGNKDTPTLTDNMCGFLPLYDMSSAALTEILFSAISYLVQEEKFPMLISGLAAGCMMFAFVRDKHPSREMHFSDLLHWLSENGYQEAITSQETPQHIKTSYLASPINSESAFVKKEWDELRELICDFGRLADAYPSFSSVERAGLRASDVLKEDTVVIAILPDPAKTEVLLRSYSMLLPSMAKAAMVHRLHASNKSKRKLLFVAQNVLLPQGFNIVPAVCNQLGAAWFFDYAGVGGMLNTGMSEKTVNAVIESCTTKVFASHDAETIGLYQREREKALSMSNLRFPLWTSPRRAIVITKTSFAELMN